MHHPQSHFAGKVVLVTGAGGSIGSEICRKLLEFGVLELRMLGHSELPLYDVEKRLRAEFYQARDPVPEIKVILGSVTNGKIVDAAVEGVDIVIHAAAHKHVPLCEQNPVEAIENNVGGTITLASAASRSGVKQFVQISTDKAVKPASIMGATKRACELFLRFLDARSSTKFTIVRFGNVINSSGSVFPLWREQIAKGQPITITDKRCTRFMMPIAAAVDLTMKAASLPRGGLYVLDMGEPVSMHEMAKNLANGVVEIVETGLRPGEKLHEELSYGGEQVKTPFPKVYQLREHERGRLLRWDDFHDLTMAAKIRHKLMAVDKLWEIVL